MNKIGLVLFFIVVLPILFYSGYEISTLTTSEGIIASMYHQQLDAILFSLNQYAWDVANGWASTVNILVNEHRGYAAGQLRTTVDRFLENNRSLQAIILSDSSFVRFQHYSRPDTSMISDVKVSALEERLRTDTETVGRLVRFEEKEYRKIEAIELPSDSGDKKLALLFILTDPAKNYTLAVIVLDEQVFIREVLSSKLREAAGDEFVLAVLKKNMPEPVYETSTIPASELRQQKELWILPNYFLGIRLKGATADELVQSRFYRNLSFIIALDIILIVGAWIVYRSMRKEMELVRMKSDFVSNVSHELRTPLALIRMFAETLEMGRIKIEGKKQEYYEIILRESERLTRLVNNILNFSKMEAGKKEYQFQPVDLNLVASDVLKTYAFHLQTEGFDPIVRLDTEVPSIVADREAVAEAIINILDNAVKYSDKEKYLKIATGTKGQNVFLEIEDHGIGIASEDHRKIFETFYRVSSGLVHTVKGSGLGLTLVKHIMDAHAGSVEVVSTPTKGSTFRLYFPLRHTK